MGVRRERDGQAVFAFGRDGLALDARPRPGIGFGVGAEVEGELAGGKGHDGGPREHGAEEKPDGPPGPFRGGIAADAPGGLVQHEPREEAEHRDRRRRTVHVRRFDGHDHADEARPEPQREEEETGVPDLQHGRIEPQERERGEDGRKERPA